MYKETTYVTTLYSLSWAFCHRPGGTTMTSTRPTAHARARTIVAVVAGVLLTAGMVVVGGASDVAHAATTSQCNAIENVGGRGVQCLITVENSLNVATGVATSTVTTTECVGAADAVSCGAAAVVIYTELTTSVNQCNASANGGGATLRCSITVINTITGAATTAAAAINQCVGSLDTGDVRACDPDPATADASVDGITQCNGSVNGGGGSMTCSVDPSLTSSNSAFSFLANQCNGSANGGGALIECSVDMSTVVLPADAGGGTGGGGTLPYTGASVSLPTVAALSALLLGLAAIVMAIARRSRAHA